MMFSTIVVFHSLTEKRSFVPIIEKEKKLRDLIANVET